MTPFVRRTLVVLISVFALLVPGGRGPTPPPSKTEVLSGWTQPTATSYDAWNAARLDRGPWSGYGFDWSTDYCSASPDNPLGFDFTAVLLAPRLRLPQLQGRRAVPREQGPRGQHLLRRHEAQVRHLQRLVRPACYSLAWTYYQAVSHFGSLAAVKQADIEKARADALPSAGRVRVSRARLSCSV